MGKLTKVYFQKYPLDWAFASQRKKNLNLI